MITARICTQLKLASLACAILALSFCVEAQEAAAPAPQSQSAPAEKSPTASAPKSTNAEEPAPRAGHRTVSPRVSTDTLVGIEKAGVLRVGVALIIPWAMHDKDGNLIGFEIDVAKKLARDLGVKVEFHPTPFRDLIPDLRAGKYDIIISGLSISAERALKVDFSDPYNETDVKLIASAKSPVAGATTLEVFDKDSVKIGVLEGSTAEDMAGVVLPNAQIIDYTNSGEAFNDLVDGKIDAAVADSPRPEIVARLFPDKVKCLCDIALSTYPAAFAVPRGDLEFVNYLNSWIASRTSNRWLLRKREYWFKSTDWENKL
ncbi:MAG: transporter substrate-binding domain-containing protein [Candidatus Acidiferrales bacterium]